MTFRMRCALLVTLVSCAGLALSGSLASQNDDVSLDKRLHKLLVERRDTLHQRSTALDERFAQGITTFESAMIARNDVLDADLQLASTKAARIAVYEQRVDICRQLEKFMTARHASAAGTVEDALMATAARLQAEIELVREQMGPE